MKVTGQFVCFGNDGYLLCRRRSPYDNVRTITTKVKGNNFVVDNRWIVPYSTLPSKILKAHCNVEYLQFCEVDQMHL
jgi:hypothetical protein